MAELFILEFDGFGETDYKKVNADLGLDPDGSGDWPEGMLSHTAAVTGSGFVVVELWENRELQEAFMTSRLQPALGRAGLTTPPRRAEWAKVTGHHVTARSAASAAK